jgi:hypothetical protein
VFNEQPHGLQAVAENNVLSVARLDASAITLTKPIKLIIIDSHFLRTREALS